MFVRIFIGKKFIEGLRIPPHMLYRSRDKIGPLPHDDIIGGTKDTFKPASDELQIWGMQNHFKV